MKTRAIMETRVVTMAVGVGMLLCSLKVCAARGDAPTQGREARRPNIVIFFNDDMGYADIGWAYFFQIVVRTDSTLSILLLQSCSKASGTKRWQPANGIWATSRSSCRPVRGSTPFTGSLTATICIRPKIWSMPTTASS